MNEVKISSLTLPHAASPSFRAGSTTNIPPRSSKLSALRGDNVREQNVGPVSGGIPPNRDTSVNACSNKLAMLRGDTQPMNGSRHKENNNRGSTFRKGKCAPKKPDIVRFMQKNGRCNIRQVRNFANVIIYFINVVCNVFPL